MEDTIPKCAQFLANQTKLSALSNDLALLTEIVHRRGVNIRYLGLLRKSCPSPPHQALILMEMVARIVKNRVRSELRNKMRFKATIVSDVFTEVILSHLNVVLGHSALSTEFWCRAVKHELQYFGDALTDEEAHETHHLKADLDVSLLYRRLQVLLAISFSPACTRAFQAKRASFAFVVADIERVSAKVKQMNIISMAEGNALAIRAMQTLIESKTQGTEQDSDRLVSLALTKYEQAIRATPDNFAMVNQYGSMLLQLGILKVRARQRALFFFEEALRKFRVSKSYNHMREIAVEIIGSDPTLSNAHPSERTSLLRVAKACYDYYLDASSLPSLPLSSLPGAFHATRVIPPDPNSSGRHRTATSLQVRPFSYADVCTARVEFAIVLAELARATHRDKYLRESGKQVRLAFTPASSVLAPTSPSPRPSPSPTPPTSPFIHDEVSGGEEGVGVSDGPVGEGTVSYGESDGEGLSVSVMEEDLDEPIPDVDEEMVADYLQTLPYSFLAACCESKALHLGLAVLLLPPRDPTVLRAEMDWERHHITSAFIHMLATRIPTITHYALARCSTLHSSAFLTLGKHVHISVVDVSHLPSFTDSDLKTYPSLPPPSLIFWFAVISWS